MEMTVGIFIRKTTQGLSNNFYLRLTVYTVYKGIQFPWIVIFHGQYNKPQSGEDELRQQLIQFPQIRDSLFLG